MLIPTLNRQNPEVVSRLVLLSKIVTVFIAILHMRKLNQQRRLSMDVQQQGELTEQKVNGKCLDEDQDSAWAHRVIWKTDMLSEIFDLDK